MMFHLEGQGPFWVTDMKGQKAWLGGPLDQEGLWGLVELVTLCWSEVPPKTSILDQ